MDAIRLNSALNGALNSALNSTLHNADLRVPGKSWTNHHPDAARHAKINSNLLSAKLLNARVRYHC